MKRFIKKALEIVADISRGEVMSYKDVAWRAGSPKAWRAVGNILGKNYNPGIPCHRVIRANGKPGGYNRGKKQKVALLQKEGVWHAIEKLLLLGLNRQRKLNLTNTYLDTSIRQNKKGAKLKSVTRDSRRKLA